MQRNRTCGWKVCSNQQVTNNSNDFLLRHQRHFDGYTSISMLRFLPLQHQSELGNAIKMLKLILQSIVHASSFRIVFYEVSAKKGKVQYIGWIGYTNLSGMCT